MLLLLLLFLLLAWLAVRDVCLNYEVVVFQPQTGTATYLGSVAIFTTILDSSHPTFFNRFWISFPPPRPDSYRSPVLHLSMLLRSLVATVYPPPPPPKSPGRRANIYLDGAPNRRPPTLVCTYLPLRATTRSYLREPVSAVPHPVAPPSPS